MLRGGPAPRPKAGTLHELLEAAAASERGLIFVDASERETRLPYRELLARVRSMAADLTSRGVAPGDRVAILLPTCPEFVVSFLGAVWAGAVPVPLYPPVRLGWLDEFHVRTAAMLRAVDAAIVLCNDRLHPLLGQAVRLASPRLGCHSIRMRTNGDMHGPVMAPGSLAVIQFSSGSTVDPKPVALTHANLLTNVAAIDQFIDTHGGGHAGVSWLPLYHDMGLIGGLLEALYHPGDLVLIPPELFLARPIFWLRAISRHHAEVSPAPNFAYGLCLKRVRDEDLVGLDLSSWRFALNGAEPIAPSILRQFADRFAPVGFDARSLLPVYGLSEATLGVTFHNRGAPLSVQHIDPTIAAKSGDVREGPRAVAGVGRPLAGVDIEIRDHHGALPDRRVGRIFVRSPGVMSGYFGRPDATTEAKPAGWLDTGDLGFTIDGELYISGRAKDVVILRGANHPPQVFEECLDGLPGIRAGCVVAFGFMADGDGGEELAILAEKDGAEEERSLVDRIRGLVTERTGIRPHTIELVEPGTLPRTSSGKLRRGETRRRWLAGELIGPRRVTTAGIVWEMTKGRLQHLRARLEG